MIKGIGIDLTEIERMINTNISEKVFLSNEIQWVKMIHIDYLYFGA